MKAHEVCMRGGGYYNDNCDLQEMAIDRSFTLLEPVKTEDDSITLADYGSSEGRNSIRLLQKILAELPSISSATLVFNDTPSNDFSSLSSSIAASWPVLSQGEKLKIHPLMVPKSYFQQILPDNFVHAGFCFTALHWLQHTPRIPNNADAPDPSTLSAAAHDDLVAFLSARFKEIRSGGSLTLCIVAQGPIEVTPVYRCLEATIRRLPSNYQLHPSIVARLPMYFRTMGEILSAVGASEGEWRVAGNATIPLEHPSSASATSERSRNAAEGASLEKYASDMARFTMTAASSFLMSEVKSQAEKRGGSESTVNEWYPGDAEFLEEVSAGFEQEFLRSYSEERIGFTYVYLRLEKP